MRIEDYIEEDFRLTPLTHVQNYEPSDLYVKPQLPGFAFTQLLDQLNGHIASTSRAKFFIQAMGGTAYWLAKHALPTPSHLHFEPQQQNEQTAKLLKQLPQAVTAVVTSAKPSLHVCCNVTCSVLTVPDTLMEWYEWCRQHSVLGHNLILAYDPMRQLQTRPEGEYFLNSSIWVTRDHAT